MQRPLIEPSSRSTQLTRQAARGWLARRWYYTPKSHRAYSVRQIAPGDRRLLAEFVHGLSTAGPARELDRDTGAVRALTALLVEHVLHGGDERAAGFVALENAGAGDRVIGAVACSPQLVGDLDAAEFGVAVAATHRGEQVGHILMATLIRHARRVGIRRLAADMQWSNRPMQRLANTLGFVAEPVGSDRQLRRLVLCLQ